MKENLYPFFRYEIFTTPHTNPSDNPASGFLLFHHRALRSNMLRATLKQMEETLHAYPMKLHGDKEGTSSVSVNDQYRIEFTEGMEAGKQIATICNITEWQCKPSAKTSHA